MVAYIFYCFPAAVCAMVARCKLPIAIRVGVSHEKIVMRKEQIKDNDESRQMASR
jgi:hypothetical protein